MPFKKILDSDTQGKWIDDLADTPELNTDDMQKAFDCINREVVIPSYNNLVQTLKADGSNDIGVTPIIGITNNKVQSVLQELTTRSDDRYTKAQIDATLATRTQKNIADLALKGDIIYVDTQDKTVLSNAKKYTDEKVLTVGSADMQQIIYDTTHRETDIFKYTDAEVVKLNNSDNNLMAKLDKHRVYTIIHAKAGTVHTFTDLPAIEGVFAAQFIATADYMENDTFTGFTAKAPGDDLILPENAFITGDLVSLIIDTKNKKLGFKLGGSVGLNQTLPPQVKNFTGFFKDQKADLNWVLPSDIKNYEGLLIVRKIGSQPNHTKDGVRIFIDKTATSHIDTGLINGTTYYYRVFPYNLRKQYQTIIENSIISGMPIYFVMPSFSGKHAIFGDIVKGKLEMYESGTLNINSDSKNYDIHIVGGGGSGGMHGGANSRNAGGGGGGGFTKTFKNVALPTGSSQVYVGGSNGNTQLLSYVAGYGYPGGDGISVETPQGLQAGQGGGGGSGGGSGEMHQNRGGDGASNGSNGGNSTCGDRIQYGGRGQGTTTRDWAEGNGTLRAGGGGGGATDLNTNSKCGYGGAGGGGKGQAFESDAPTPGSVNTGGGGGGKSWVAHAKAAGGSGIAMIRWGY